MEAAMHRLTLVLLSIMTFALAGSLAVSQPATTTAQSAAATIAVPTIVVPPLCDGLVVTIQAVAGITTYGTTGADVIRGTSGDDLIFADEGDDTVCGLEGV